MPYVYYFQGVIYDLGGCGDYQLSIYANTTVSIFY